MPFLMSYRYLEDIALDDVAFEAEAPTIEGLFIEAAKALSETMVSISGLGTAIESEICLSASSMDNLLFDWLAELIFLKDAEQLFFKKFDVTIAKRDSPAPHYELKAKVRGDRINPETHVLRNDVKAVTMHKFKLEERPGKFTARVVLDI